MSFSVPSFVTLNRFDSKGFGTSSKTAGSNYRRISFIPPLGGKSLYLPSPPR